MNPIHLSFKKLWNGNHFSKLKKGYNSQNNRWILFKIEPDLYFMIIYLCTKFQSNTLIFFKDIVRKPKVLRTGRTGQTGQTYVWTAVILYHWKWRGHKN